jgi:hypothetical protein
MRPPVARRGRYDSRNISDVRSEAARAGSEAAPGTPEALAKRYADWRELFGKVAKDAGIKPQ